MLRRNKQLRIFFLATPLVLVLVSVLGALLTKAATAYALECQTCHDQLARQMAIRQCEACHDGSDIRLILTRDMGLYQRIHYEEEIVNAGKTFDSGGGDGATALKGWSITGDLPNWHALIDEHSLIPGTDE